MAIHIIRGPGPGRHADNGSPRNASDRGPCRPWQKREWRPTREVVQSDNACNGRYIHRTAAKLAWCGIPAIVLPSYWKSSTCIAHGLVHKVMRTGNAFTCPSCLATGHTHGNAGLTLASDLFPEIKQART